MSSGPPDDVTRQTLQHYEREARGFWEGTRDHDVSQNRAALLEALASGGPEGSPPGSGRYRLLDLGCGPGRDLAAFRALGHEAVGLDGCLAFVQMAREHSGCEVWQQNLVSLQLPARSFDGIFANASLFHVPSSEIARVLGELHEALRPRGVLFVSNPRRSEGAPPSEGWSGDRYSCFHDLADWRRLCTAAGLLELGHYYRPEGRPREQQPWLATVWRRS